MSSTNVDIPALERPFFFDGQRLTADDLADVQAFDRQLRWLHNRSLHDWGVVFGYPVSGDRGSRSVSVGQGLALDCRGRELVGSEALELAVPPVSGAPAGGPATWYLTISYLEDADVEPVRRQGVCETEGAVRRPERARVRWQDPADADPVARYRNGLDVILASARIENCRLAAPVSLAERRDAVGVLRPYVAAGRTPPGATPWHLWPEPAPLGVAANVSTNSGGFRSTPSYAAHVVGARRFDGTLEGTERRFVVDGYAHVADATAGGFELRVILVTASTISSETYTVTAADVREVIRATADRLAKEISLPWTISDANVDKFVAYHGLDQPGATVAAGDRYAVGPLIPGPFGLFIRVEVEEPDFQPAIAAIAKSRPGVIAVELAKANGLDTSPALTIGEDLVVPGTSLPMNPQTVLTDEFLGYLQTSLDWHVVWLGVES